VLVHLPAARPGLAIVSNYEVQDKVAWQATMFVKLGRKYPAPMFGCEWGRVIEEQHTVLLVLHDGEGQG